LDHAGKTWVQEMDNEICVGFFFIFFLFFFFFLKKNPYLKLFWGQKMEGDSQGVSTRRRLEGPIGV
jgi:hypothetical protein